MLGCSKGRPALTYASGREFLWPCTIQKHQLRMNGLPVIRDGSWMWLVAVELAGLSVFDQLYYYLVMLLVSWPSPQCANPGSSHVCFEGSFNSRRS